MWKTRFVERFPCRIPLMGAPMLGPSGGRLAVETCRAGALGFIAAGHLQHVAAVEREIQLFLQLQEQQTKASPLCLGFIGHSAFGSRRGWTEYEYLLDQYRPAVVQCFAPAIVESNGRTNVDVAHEYDALVLAQVCTVQEGMEAARAGVDGLIAQGSEAGGHGVRRELGNATLTLAADLLRLVPNIPILAAGGIVNGAGLAAALALGCDGVVVGTRLWASQEALGHDSFKQRLVEASSCDDVVRTTVMDQIQNAYVTTPWPEPYHSMSVVRNSLTEKWDGRYVELQAALSTNSKIVSDYQTAQKEGNVDGTAVHAGQGVGAVTSVESAFDIISRIEQEAKEIIQRLPSVLP
jgi:nitronate monooxygenase